MGMMKFLNGKVFFLAGLIILIGNHVYAAPDICHSIKSYEYLNITDSGPGKRIRGYICFVTNDDPNLTGIVTLRNTSRTGDWDLLVGTSFDPKTKRVYGAIDYKNNSGTENELLWLPGDSYKEYVIVAYPTSSTPSEACVIFHRIDTAEIAGEAIIMATAQSILEFLVSSENDSQEDRNQKSRAISGGMSVLKRNNLAAVGYDMVLNEISVQLSNAFGGGSWLFTFGMNYFGGYLEESGKFIFRGNSACGN